MRLARWLLVPCVLATAAPALSQDEAPRTYLRVEVTGSHSVHVRFFARRGAGPRVDQRIEPGESITLPYDVCYEWQRTYGASEIDWSPLNTACAPRRGRFPQPGPPVVLTYVLAN